MGKLFRIPASVVCALMLSANIVAAAELRVFGVAPVRAAMTSLGPDFTRDSGQPVNLNIIAANLVEPQKLAGENYDIAILGTAAMQALENAGGIRPGSRVPLARTGIGVAVREGSPVPDLSTADAFRQAMLAARSIVYRDTAQADLSGAMAERILMQAGIHDALKSKIRIESLSVSHELIAKGEIEIGLYNVSEAPSKGVILAGPVPAPLQIYSSYEVAIMTRAAAPDVAADFIAFITGNKARERWQKVGMEPLSGR
jgi:molybdate transport system substrate-binding protein